MKYSFEFDPVNKILLGRFEGRITDESLGEFYRTGQKHWAATDASAAITDYTAATEWAVSHEFIRALASEQPAVADPAKRPRMVVAPTARPGSVYPACFRSWESRNDPYLKSCAPWTKPLKNSGLNPPTSNPCRDRQQRWAR